jgi:hypothetical protein
VRAGARGDRRDGVLSHEAQVDRRDQTNRRSVRRLQRGEDRPGPRRNGGERDRIAEQRRPGNRRMDPPRTRPARHVCCRSARRRRMARAAVRWSSRHAGPPSTCGRDRIGVLWCDSLVRQHRDRGAAPVSERGDDRELRFRNGRHLHGQVRERRHDDLRRADQIGVAEDGDSSRVPPADRALTGGPARSGSSRSPSAAVVATGSAAPSRPGSARSPRPSMVNPRPPSIRPNPDRSRR